MVSTILLILAFVLLIVASAGVNHPRVNLGWLGLAVWVLSIILQGVSR